MTILKSQLVLNIMLITLLFLPDSAIPQDLYINEIMSVNNCTLIDEDGDYSDWIEIYNGNQSSVNLNGYFISDDPSAPEKWCISNAIVEADSFLLIFASDKDRNGWPNQLHSNFRLSSNGESLILSDPDTLVIDRIDFPPMSSDISFGRVGNGNDTFGLFDIPTPNADNDSPSLPLLQATPPSISIPSGLYQDGTTLELFSTEGTIFYSTDGSIPDAGSNEYESPFSLDSVTVIRAITLVPNKRASEVVNSTYIVNFESELAIISIITNPPNLWDQETGIYVTGYDPGVPPDSGSNYWQDWERPAFFEFFDEDGSHNFSQHLGMRTHGGYSRSYPQKSLRFYARNEYGNPIINEQILPNKPLFEYKRFIVRNSGNDWYQTLFRDALVADLIRPTEISHQAYRPSVVFINGEYWGIQNIRERIDKYYLKYNFGADPESVDLVDLGRTAIEGSSVFYQSMEQYTLSNDVSEQSVIDSLDSIMNIDNFIQYYAAQIFICNTDWPWNNNKCWRSVDPDSRFEWIMFDTDFGFGGRYNYDFNWLSFATSDTLIEDLTYPSFNRLFRRLLENNEFKDNFIIRSCDMANIIFEKDKVLNRIDDFKSRIDSEMERHIARWYPDYEWEESVEVMRDFIRFRKEYTLQHLREKFALGDAAELIINIPENSHGKVKVNAFWIDIENFSGTYFVNSPLQLIAEPTTGFRFAGWSGDIESENDTLNFVFEGETTLQPNFEPVPNSTPIVVINEINYCSCESFDPGDWIELYAFNQNVDLSGWRLSDGVDSTEFIFPNGLILSEGSFLVIARDIEQFSEAFVSLPTPIGGLDFGLCSEGDKVVLKDQNENVIDFVEYESSYPWPSQPNGCGPTLELIDPSLPNQHEHNWAASFINYGTPNMSSSDIPDPEYSAIPVDFKIEKIYPNPFNASTRIEISLPRRSDTKIFLYNVLGQFVKEIHSGYISSGTYSFFVSGADLPSGIYFIQAVVPGKFNQTEKIILLK
jgi:CotH kinase protein/Lamin Tail Domain/Fn3 associated/Secretion system C-terminal sorting domain